MSQQQQFVERTALLVDKPTFDPINNALKALLGVASDGTEVTPAKTRALEAVMADIAIGRSVIWRDQLQGAEKLSARGHTTYDFRRADSLSAAADKPLPSEQPKPVSLTTTSHPNGNLPIEMEGILLDFIAMLDGLSMANKQEFVRWGAKGADGEIPEFLGSAVETLNEAVKQFSAPNKQTMDDAMNRGIRINSEIVKNIPAIFDSALKASKIFSDKSESFVSADALRAIGRPVNLLTWYDVDGDGNPFVTPDHTAKAIKANEETIKKIYIERLDLILKNGGLGNDAGDVKTRIVALKKWIEDSKKLDVYGDDGLLERLYDLKKQIEEEKYIILNKEMIRGEESSLTVLDATIAMVQNSGEILAKKEYRQNAETIRSAIQVLGDKLTQEGIITPDEAKNSRKLLSIINNDKDRAAMIRSFVASDQKPEGEIDAATLSYYNMIAFLRQANEHPQAVHSMVIAETGAMREEDFTGQSQAIRKQQLTSQKGLNDLLSAQFLLEAVTPKGQKPALEFRGLFEGRLPAENVPEMLATLFERSPEFKKRYEDVITIMFAQSDTSREHGIMSILTVFESINQIKKLTADLASDMARSLHPNNTEEQEKAAKEFAIQIKLGAGAALSRGFPPSLLYSDDTTLQGGSMVYLSGMVDKFAEWMIATKAVNEFGHRLASEEAERVSRFSYTGNNLLMDTDAISPKVQEYIEELGLKGCKRHEQFMDDPRADAWFDNSPYTSIVSPNNKGPRPNKKKGGDGAEVFPPHSDRHTQRAIGSGLAQYMEGSNPIFTLGLPEFFQLEDGKLSEKTRDKVIAILKESPVHNEMISRAELGILLSDYETAWAAHGYGRERDNNNEIWISREGEKIKLKDLAAEYTKAYEKNPPDFANHSSLGKFGADAIALAYQDLTNEQVARAIYEVRLEQRRTFAREKSGGIKAGAGTIREINPADFTPEHLSEIIHPVQQGQFDAIRPILKEARTEMAKENASWLKEGAGWNDQQRKEFADKNYYNYIAVEQIVEGAMALSFVLTQQQMLHDNWKTSDRGQAAR